MTDLNTDHLSQRERYLMSMVYSAFLGYTKDQDHAARQVNYIVKSADELEPATTPQPSADAVLVPKGAAETARTVAEEWLAMFSDIPGLEKYERYTYGPAVEQLRDELESLLSGGSHA